MKAKVNIEPGFAGSPRFRIEIAEVKRRDSRASLASSHDSSVSILMSWSRRSPVAGPRI